MRSFFDLIKIIEVTNRGILIQITHRALIVSFLLQRLWSIGCSHTVDDSAFVPTWANVILVNWLWGLHARRTDQPGVTSIAEAYRRLALRMDHSFFHLNGRGRTESL